MGKILKQGNLIIVEYSIDDLLAQPYPFKTTTLGGGVEGRIVYEEFDKDRTFGELIRRSALNLVRTKKDEFYNQEPRNILVVGEGDKIQARMSNWYYPGQLQYSVIARRRVPDPVSA